MSNVQPPPPEDPGAQPSAGGDFGPGGYPRHPGTPEAQPAAAVAQPSSIRLAVRLMWGGAVVSLISLIVTVATLGSLKSQIREDLTSSGQDVTDSAIDAAYTITIVVGVFFTVLAIGLWLWMAWKNGQGRSWARVVATVLGVFNVISTLFTAFSQSATPVTTTLGIVNLVLAVVILVLLWRKESSAFYAAMSNRGPQYA